MSSFDEDTRCVRRDFCEFVDHPSTEEAEPDEYFQSLGVSYILDEVHGTALVRNFRPHRPARAGARLQRCDAKAYVLTCVDMRRFLEVPQLHGVPTLLDWWLTGAGPGAAMRYILVLPAYDTDDQGDEDGYLYYTIRVTQIALNLLKRHIMYLGDVHCEGDTVVFEDPRAYRPFTERHRSTLLRWHAELCRKRFGHTFESHTLQERLQEVQP